MNNLVWIHQMEDNEGYNGRQKHYRIYYVNKLTDARDLYHLKHRLPLRNCGRRTAVIFVIVSSLLTSLL